jgi:hypothetical protein
MENPRLSYRTDIDVSGKCGSCAYYEPVIKKQHGIMTEFARGSCGITNTYKQRTEKCIKYKEKGEEKC